MVKTQRYFESLCFSFFVTNEREHLIHFCCAHVLWHRWFRQKCGICFDPQRYCTMIYTQITTDLAKAHATYIHLHCTLTDFFRIALFLWLGSVLISAVHTTIHL